MSEQPHTQLIFEASGQAIDFSPFVNKYGFALGLIPEGAEDSPQYFSDLIDLEQFDKEQWHLESSVEETQL